MTDVLSLAGRVIVPHPVTGRVWTGRPAQAPAGSVLVSRSATPDLVLGMERLVGVVFEADGVASHAAILAREWGLPCFVGVAGCVQAARSYERVSLQPAEKQVIFSGHGA